MKMPGGRGNDGSESTSANCSGAENRSNVQLGGGFIFLSPLFGEGGRIQLNVPGS